MCLFRREIENILDASVKKYFVVSVSCILKNMATVCVRKEVPYDLSKLANLDSLAGF